MRIVKTGLVGTALAAGLLFAGAASASAANYDVGQVSYNYETPGMVTKQVWNGSSWDAVACFPAHSVR